MGDMGTTKEVSSVTGTYIGTVAYMAPEIIRNLPYSLSADMYSVGLIMWEIWNGKRIGRLDKLRCLTDSGIAKVQRINDVLLNEEKFKMALPSTTGFPTQETRMRAWANIVTQCCSFDAENRPSVGEAHEAIKKVT